MHLESQFGLCEPPLELLLECRLLGKGARQSAVLVFRTRGQWLSNCIRRDLWWGSNFAVRRVVFWRAGGFPVDWPCWEDNDLSLRVSRITPVRFDPDLIVYASSRRAQEGWGKLGRDTTIRAVERFVLRRPPSIPMVDLR